ncbi:hypothetical protein [Acetivibrio clariflavus]|uniref:Uncharacterized protein n=1 Tax=Acetivibrio clariflavus (strain DSM 19732 / NBRC 101661 / EBR45) TaxID=720554 RepID=G8M197_ACECE|nr:hypothetical protein [Acetivibrio clariflavus]AEV68073.1 hypothetical protein Clocl_1422 [Acetivibrio clariflavus DSM 19732]
MYPYNRRFYIGREPEKKIEKNEVESSENIEANSLTSADTENIKMLLENVDEIKNSLKKLEENITDIASKLANLENRFDVESIYRSIENSFRNMQIQYSHANPNNQHYSMKTSGYDYKNREDEPNTSHQPDKNNQTPIMPGTGFSFITADYLRNLSKNRYNNI